MGQRRTRLPFIERWFDEHSYIIWIKIIKEEFHIEEMSSFYPPSLEDELEQIEKQRKKRDNAIIARHEENKKKIYASAYGTNELALFQQDKSQAQPSLQKIDKQVKQSFTSIQKSVCEHIEKITQEQKLFLKQQISELRKEVTKIKNAYSDQTETTGSHLRDRSINGDSDNQLVERRSVERKLRNQPGNSNELDANKVLKWIMKEAKAKGNQGNNPLQQLMGKIGQLSKGKQNLEKGVQNKKKDKPKKQRSSSRNQSEPKKQKNKKLLQKNPSIINIEENQKPPKKKKPSIINIEENQKPAKKKKPSIINIDIQEEEHKNNKLGQTRNPPRRSAQHSEESKSNKPKRDKPPSSAAIPGKAQNKLVDKNSRARPSITVDKKGEQKNNKNESFIQNQGKSEKPVTQTNKPGKLPSRSKLDSSIKPEKKGSQSRIKEDNKDGKKEERQSKPTRKPSSKNLDPQKKKKGKQESQA